MPDQGPAELISGESSFPGLQMTVFSRGRERERERERERSSVSSYKGTNPIMRAPFS